MERLFILRCVLKSIVRAPKFNLQPALITLLCLGLLTGCTPTETIEAPSLTLLPNTPPVTPVIPIPTPGDLVGNTPEVVVTKKVMEEVATIQETAKSEPTLALTLDDVDLLKGESLLDNPDELKGWVQ